MNVRQILISSTTMLMLSLILGSGAAFAQDDPVVDSATPSSAIQGTYDLNVEIVGSNFGRGAEVSFHEPVEDPRKFGPPAHGIAVKKVKAMGSSRLIVTMDVAADAYLGDTDIQVLYRSRKGKGTTLFKVLSNDSTQPSECMLDFDAEFDDLEEDGVYSDGIDVPYYAFGGTGLRLDTNGSMKLERSNDTRFVTIDFSKTTDDSGNVLDCSRNDAHSPFGAAGFCTEQKGVDMRFEHQVQVLEENGLCLQGLGEVNARRISMGFLFLQSPGGLLANEFKNGKQNGDGSTALKLNYGCQGPNLLQDDLRIGQNGQNDYRAVVTRVDDYSWRIEGEWACLATNLGHKLEDAAGNTIYLRMPFGLTIVDVNAPPGN